ncbi:anaerobic ribonucleoside-triphosphate reductase activating protein [Pseudomonadota bacterium]
MLPITAITPFTLQDFPDHTASIIWFGGCNFRCPYCHNPEFIIDEFKVMDEKKVWDFLESRRNLLDGVVLSGGECTIPNGIIEFIKKIKKLKFKVKIDTNGMRTEIVRELIDKNLIDCLALDYKAQKEKFESISGSKEFDKFSKTLDYLILKNFPFEIRTTVHTDLLDENDINSIIRDLENRGFKTGNYYIQNFSNTKGRTLGNINNQKRIINKKKIISSEDFSVLFRNFDD